MKFRNFLKTIPMKLYAILLAVILFSFFSNDFGLVDIQKTALILAVGIDRTEQGFLLTSQIAVPKGSDRTTGGTSSVEITSEGVTVSDCITALYSKTGWVPKLVFCDLLLIGEEAAKEDVFVYLNYFLRNEYMPDSCQMAVCEGKATDVISSQSAIDDASSLAITKLFSDAAQKSGKVMPNTLKDFSIGRYGVSASSYLPFVSMTDQEGAQDSGGSGGSGTPQSEEPQKIYTAAKTALFLEGKMVSVLGEDETLAFSLLEGNVFAGTFNAADREEPVTLTVIKNEGGVSLDITDRPTAKLSLNVLLRLCCRGTSAPLEDTMGDDVSEEVLENAKEVLTGYVQRLWDTCKESGCDFLFLKRSLYRSSPKQYAEWKDTLLESADAEIRTQVHSKS